MVVSSYSSAPSKENAAILNDNNDTLKGALISTDICGFEWKHFLNSYVLSIQVNNIIFYTNPQLHIMYLYETKYGIIII